MATFPSAPVKPDPIASISSDIVDAPVDHLFRQQSGRLVAALTRMLGPQHLEIAEDSVQDALLQAVRLWPYQSIPANPAGWLWQVARSRALDRLRRNTILRDKVMPRLTTEQDLEASDIPLPETLREDELRDDSLRLVFTCCQPMLDQEDQIALTLKTVCGLGTGEIARALLVSEPAIAKRLVRARQRLRDARPPFEVPRGEALTGRLQIVLQVLYLLFNEGYNASGGEQLIRRELCQEAIRLCRLVVEHPATNLSAVHGLLALMLFQASRFDARLDACDDILPLSEQDRGRWDGAMIQEALYHCATACAAGFQDEYTLQAAIAGCHCVAPSDEETAWPTILTLYDRLLGLEPTPVVALNRVVAFARVHGAQAGLIELERIPNAKRLETYYLYHVIRADLLCRTGRPDRAVAACQRALDLTDVPSEQRFLTRRLEAVSGSSDPFKKNCPAPVLAEIARPS